MAGHTIQREWFSSSVISKEIYPLLDAEIEVIDLEDLSYTW